MNENVFMSLMDKRFQYCRNLMSPKSKEYSRGDEKLHNFKTAAKISNTTPRKALWGMMVKHLVSIKDMVDYNENPDVETIDAKFSDMINYLVLLEAIITEERDDTDNGAITLRDCIIWLLKGDWLR